MRFLEFSHDSDWYRQMQELRQEVLRRPLGLDLHAADLSAEAGYRHFGLESGGRLVACLMVVSLPGKTVQLRQMAVFPEQQGRGLGRQLMRAVEEILRADGIDRIRLNAREVAAGFYTSLGYRIEGGPFVEVGIPHLLMVKTL